jgi:hypothetical protein
VFCGGAVNRRTRTRDLFIIAMDKNAGEKLKMTVYYVLYRPKSAYSSLLSLQAVSAY